MVVRRKELESGGVIMKRGTQKINEVMVSWINRPLVGQSGWSA
jgi:hypothetical protein